MKTVLVWYNVEQLNRCLNEDCDILSVEVTNAGA